MLVAVDQFDSGLFCRLCDCLRDTSEEEKCRNLSFVNRFCPASDRFRPKIVSVRLCSEDPAAQIPCLVILGDTEDEKECTVGYQCIHLSVYLAFRLLSHLSQQILRFSSQILQDSFNRFNVSHQKTALGGCFPQHISSFRSRRFKFSAAR